MIRWLIKLWRLPDELSSALDMQTATLMGLSTDLGAMMSALDDLKAAVAANAVVEASAITLLQGLKQRLDDALASGDVGVLQQEVATLANELGVQTGALAAAVAANTIAGPQAAAPETKPPIPEPIGPSGETTGAIGETNVPISEPLATTEVAGADHGRPGHAGPEHPVGPATRLQPAAQPLMP